MKIHRTKIGEFLREANGKIVTVRFVKLDGSHRHITGTISKDQFIG